MIRRLLAAEIRLQNCFHKNWSLVKILLLSASFVWQYFKVHTSCLSFQSKMYWYSASQHYVPYKLDTDFEGPCLGSSQYPAWRHFEEANPELLAPFRSLHHLQVIHKIFSNLVQGWTGLSGPPRPTGAAWFSAPNGAKSRLFRLEMGRGDGTGTSFLGLPNLRQLNTKSVIRMRCKYRTFREINYTSILYINECVSLILWTNSMR